MIPGFTDAVYEDESRRIAYSVGGSGAPLLLLHGFPQTRAMWTEIAPALARNHTVIAADLRGYGASHKPFDVSAYSFREMGADMLALMRTLGHERFHLVGHDRGARTAHRMALDAGLRIQSLTLMDVVPTHLLLNELSQNVAKAYYHWFFLAQPAPFPERLIAADPDYFFESCLLGWGAAKLEDFVPGQLAAYRAAWRDPDAVRGMCNDYRAALEVDFDLDAQDLARKVTAPTLVLFGADGAMAKAYDVPGTWRDRLEAMSSAAIPGGHFFPDTSPKATAKAIANFLEGLA